jgi:protein SCO1/2
VDSSQYISKYHTITDFSFVNQNGKNITQKIMKADLCSRFFLYHLQTICPKMTANLFEVQKRLLTIKVMLLSHTVFQVDSVPVLKEICNKIWC